MADRLVQEVRIAVRSREGAHWGDLRLRATAKVAHEPFEVADLVCGNVPKVRQPGSSESIEYCIREPLAGLSRVMLLEETGYDVVFREASGRTVTMFPRLTDNIYRENLFSEKPEHKAGTLNFGSYVGRTWLSVEVEGEESAPVPIEVRSKKLGYADEYVAMMGDLSRDCSALIYSLSSPVHQAFHFSDLNRETLFEDYLFLEYLFKDGNLPTAYARVREAPKSLLINYRETVPIGHASNVGPGDLVAMVCDTGSLVQPATTPRNWPASMRGYVPVEITQTRARETRDIPENRLVKFFLEQVLELAVALLEKSEHRAQEGGMVGIRERLVYFVEEVSGYLADEWLKDVGELTAVPLNSQTLLKKDGYRELYRYWRDFDFAFRFKWDALEDDVLAAEKRMHQLYEYWCFFRLVEALRSFATQKTSMDKLVRYSKDRWEVELKAGRASRLRFEHEAADGKPVRIDLFYNRGFSARTTIRGSYSLPFRPDYTVSISSEGQQEPVYCHFDAKYRSQEELKNFIFADPSSGAAEASAIDELSADEAQAVSEQKAAERNREYKDADIYKMHTYKDAIFYSQGAYVLYPGDKMGLYRELTEPTDAMDIPSVGAFPLKPASGDHFAATEPRLAAFVRRVAENAASNH